MKRFNIALVMISAVGFAGFAVSTVSADIYTWSDENGVKYFTNRAPPEHATLFMKTHEIPYDEEADKQRREIESLAAARQELAEREAFLLEQQQEAERRIAAANARADAALRKADLILQDAQAVSEDDDNGDSISYGYNFYRPWYGSGTRYLYHGYNRWDGGLYRKKSHPEHKRHHYQNKPYHSKYKKGIQSHTRPSHYNSRQGTYSARRHSNAIGGRIQTHRSRVATFRGRHGRF